MVDLCGVNGGLPFAAGRQRQIPVRTCLRIHAKFLLLERENSFVGGAHDVHYCFQVNYSSSIRSNSVVRTMGNRLIGRCAVEFCTKGARRTNASI